MKNYSSIEIKATAAFMRVLVVTILFGASSAVFAQQGGGQRQDPGERFDRALVIMVDSVGIDEKQVEQVKVVNSKYEKTFTDAREEMQSGGDRNQMREKVKNIMKDYDKEILAILTSEQKVKYAKVKENRKAQMQQQQNSRPENAKKSGRGQRGPQ